MIDLGLSKLALIGVVALVIIGPEKLPKVARMAGSLLGRAQRYINDVKAEVGREIELDELRKMQKGMQDTAQDVENSIAQNFSSTQDELQSAWHHDDASEYVAHPSHLAIKARDFRKKKLLKTSAIPTWYKQRHGGKTRVISAAARVAKYRPGSNKLSSFF